MTAHSRCPKHQQYWVTFLNNVSESQRVIFEKNLMQKETSGMLENLKMASQTKPNKTPHTKNALTATQTWGFQAHTRHHNEYYNRYPLLQRRKPHAQVNNSCKCQDNMSNAQYSRQPHQYDWQNTNMQTHLLEAQDKIANTLWTRWFARTTEGTPTAFPTRRWNWIIEKHCEASHGTGLSELLTTTNQHPPQNDHLLSILVTCSNFDYLVWLTGITR